MLTAGSSAQFLSLFTTGAPTATGAALQRRCLLALEIGRAIRFLSETTSRLACRFLTTRRSARPGITPELAEAQLEYLAAAGVGTCRWARRTPGHLTISPNGSAYPSGTLHRRDRQVTGVRRADRQVEEVVDAGGGQALELRLGLLGRDPGRADRLVVGKRQADREVVSDLRPDRTSDLEREQAALLDAAPVAVGAPVVERAQELADEPAVSTVHLDAVEPPGADVARRAGEVGDDLRQVGLVERQRRVAAGRRDARRRPDGPPPLEADRALALGAGRDELGEEARLERRKLGRQGGELPPPAARRRPAASAGTRCR